MSSRKCFSFSEKRAIIQAIDDGQRKRDVARQFNIKFSTLSTIYKQKDDILAFSENDAKKKKRAADYPGLEKCLVEWLIECRNKHIPIGGDLLKEKAKRCAVSMGYTEFKGSDGWLGKFKKRHKIERVKAYDTMCLEWKNELSYWVRDYEEKNIFAADEVGLFYRCLPHHNMCFQNETCRDGKHSKERITLLLAANMDGSEKLSPLMIGKSPKPVSFNHMKTFPLPYRSNKRSWMTPELFIEWLHELDNYMKLQNRYILLFVDNCPTHIEPTLNNIKMVFYPKNCGPKFQPLSCGVIKNFKTLYRREVVKNTLISYLEVGYVDENKITLITAMRMTDKAWNNVEGSLIKNCFKSCGFVTDNEVETEYTEVLNIPEWSDFQKINQNAITFQQYVNFDDAIATAECLNGDEDLQDESGDQVNQEESIKNVTFLEAKIILDRLRCFFEAKNIDKNIFQTLNVIDNEIDETKSQNESIFSFFD